ncbi:hypothetical protein BPAE_0065g00010, partial [Botrytis paeoniae]
APAPAPIPKPQTLYFAYGSNLSLTQMQTRCPGSTYIGMGILQDYLWIVNQRGYANIICCGDSGVNSESNSETGEGIKDGKDIEIENGIGSANANANKNPSTSPPRHAKETTTKLPSTPPQNPPNIVYGLLYTLSHRDENLLDISEGVPFAYTKISPLITLLSISPSLAAPTISFLLSLFPGSVSGSGVSSAGLAFPSLSPSSPPTASQPSQPSPPLQIRALTYIDTHRITPSAPNPEYVTRMNRGIRDALSKGFPPSYVRDVMRLYIPASEEGGDC